MVQVINSLWFNLNSFYTVDIPLPGQCAEMLQIFSLPAYARLTLPRCDTRAKGIILERSRKARFPANINLVRGAVISPEEHDSILGRCTQRIAWASRNELVACLLACGPSSRSPANPSACLNNGCLGVKGETSDLLPDKEKTNETLTSTAGYGEISPKRKRRSIFSPN